MEKLKTATRPIVTLLVAFAVVAGFLVGRISSAEFLPLAASVLCSACRHPLLRVTEEPSR